MFKRHLGRSLKLGIVAFATLILGQSSSAIAGDTKVAPETRTVAILEAEKAGDIAVSVRGQGEDRVKFSITNRSSRRLNVVIPPGLVASSTPGQTMQSMGLGSVTSNPGRFGA